MPVCSLLLAVSPSRFSVYILGVGRRGAWGLLFSLSGLLLLFFYCFKIFCLFFILLLFLLGFISLSGLLLFLPTLSDSLPPRWGEEPVKPSQIVCMIAGNLSKRDYFLATGLLLCLVYFGC